MATTPPGIQVQLEAWSQQGAILPEKSVGSSWEGGRGSIEWVISSTRSCIWWRTSWYWVVFNGYYRRGNNIIILFKQSLDPVDRYSRVVDKNNGNNTAINSTQPPTALGQFRSPSNNTSPLHASPTVPVTIPTHLIHVCTVLCKWIGSFGVRNVMSSPNFSQLITRYLNKK